MNFPIIGKAPRKIFQSLEKQGGCFSRDWKTGAGGSALIVALWVILILSLLIGSFAFEMHIEAGIASYYRKRMRAEYAALGGVELAKMVLEKSKENSGPAPADAGAGDEPEGPYDAAIERIGKGASVKLTEALDRAEIEVTIYPAESRRNINKLSEDDWEDLLDIAGVPEDRRDALIDCFFDWTDPNTAHRINGAESDDSYYKEHEIEVKNGPLDTVDELSLIKNFTPAIVYGGTLEDDPDVFITGLASMLTAWGDGRVNPNSANRETLASLGLEDWQIDAVMEYREPSPEHEEGQYYESIDDVIDIGGLPEDLRSKLVIEEAKFFRVDAIGRSGKSPPVSRIISCVLKLDEGKVFPVYWIEEPTR